MNPTISQGAIRAFHRRLHQWYAVHGRKNLPWRHTSDPYAIYVSEVMLQQTQVETVLARYYFPFLKRFPTLNALAKATQDEVLSAWQGLGYYNRAIHLHRAAQQCEGRLPRRIEDINALPGIGRNTAHAIAAFAYHQPAPVMEANVRRVLSRIFALKTPVVPELWDKAQALLDSKNSFDYNQAMMDIGAMVCTRRTPHCTECPAQDICKGIMSPATYPATRKKKPVPVRHRHILVRQNAKGQYFALPRKGKFLNGLYHFVESETRPHQGNHIGHIRQQYSHFTLEAEIWLAEEKNIAGQGWYSLSQLKKLPVSMAEKKVLGLLERC